MNTQASIDRPGRQEGFTLVELAIVCVVIGILASIAVPNYARTKARANYASCASNARNLYAAATIYAGDHGIRDAVLGSEDLLAAQAVAASLTDCPDDRDNSHDDYDVTIVAGEATDAVCLIYPGEHVWRH
jgi:prepilin-type N-terminal cleavage/methylation domain-containing protein